MPPLNTQNLPLPPSGNTIGPGWSPRSPGIIAASRNKVSFPFPKENQLRKPATPPPVPAATGSIMQQIVQAARWNKVVIIKYRKKTDNYRLRTIPIEPYEIKNGYLWGYCLQHFKIHKFIPANIVSVEQTDRKFTPRWPIRL